jgi:preprotein translocase subunit SecY
MKSFIDTLRNIWKIEELRNRILFTLGMLLIFRLGSFVVLPGIDPQVYKAVIGSGGSGGLVGLINLFSGGGFNNASVFALGIMPYISASIAVQLLGFAVPYFQKLQKDGESGRRQLNQITRYLTVAVTAFQASGYYVYLKSLQGGVGGAEFIVINNTLFWFTAVIVLTSGTLFCMWLGEKITDRGIGNGISLLIMIGIVAGLPGALIAEFGLREQEGQIMSFVIELVFLVVVVLGTVALVQGVRRVPVQYAKQIRGNRIMGGTRQFIPIKVNAAGVMPIIFAQALMFIPGFFRQLMPESQSNVLALLNDYTSVPYNLIYFFLVVIFTYFYTAITVNPVQIADDLKRNGGFIPGVKPGRRTAEFLDNILSRVTLPGSIFLGIVAILPAFAGAFGVSQAFALFFGGTSLLIMVGVVLDTLQQIESHLIMRHYDGLMKSGRVKGRANAGVGASF